jgi:hypothetical protein
MEALQESKSLSIDSKEFHQKMVEFLLNREPDFAGSNVSYYALGRFSISLFMYESLSSLEIHDCAQEFHVVLIDIKTRVSASKTFHSEELLNMDLPEQFECFRHKYIAALNDLTGTVEDIFRLRPIVKSARN